MIKKSTLLGMLFFSAASVLTAQVTTTPATTSAPTEEVKKFEQTFSIKGYTQVNFAIAPNDSLSEFGQTPMGFGLRRFRFMPYGELTENISWGVQVAADKMAFSVITAYIDMKIKGDKFKIMAGMIDNSGAYQGSGLSSANLILVDRACVVNAWASNFYTSGFYDLGVKLYGKTDKVQYALVLANANGKEAFNETSSLQSGSTDPYVKPFNGLKEIARVDVTPMKGLQIGAWGGNASFFQTVTYVRKSTSVKDSASVKDCKSVSYGFDIVYDSEKIRAQASYIGGTYDLYKAGTEKKDDTFQPGKEYNGFYFHGGYKIGSFMPTVGFDMYTPNSDADPVQTYSNITLGVDAFIGKSVKFQANYVYRTEKENEYDNNFLIFNLQYTFGKKNL